MDIVDAINETLEWYTSSDSMSWQPETTPFPPLGDHWVNVARRLSAQTGMDGYAAWLLTADFAAYQDASPFAEIVGPAQRGPGSAAGQALARLYEIRFAVVASAFIREVDRLQAIADSGNAAESAA
jgi:hypothetical protein